MYLFNYGLKSSLLCLQKKHLVSKHDQKPSVQELAARASALVLNDTSQNIVPPNSAYQFEVTWRGFSGNRTLEAQLLKVWSPLVIFFDMLSYVSWFVYSI